VTGGPALLVDFGNTRLKWALLADGALRPAGAVTHAAGGVGATLRPAWHGLPGPERVLVGSVAGVEADADLRALCLDLWGREPLFVKATARAAGVTSGYHAPERLGVDRWLALIAVHADGRGAACVVDCGTAVTIDVIDDAGRHRGGLILPGLQLMRECLLSRTRIPPFIAPAACPELGQDTGAAVANGVLLAVVGAVRETLGRGAELCGGTTRLVVTGGDAMTFSKGLPGRVELRPDLVLEGLAVVAGIDET
jgi:type III pantothenate kinase